MAVETEMPQIHVIGKLGEIPLVKCAYDTGTGVYNRVKESNGLITWTLQSAEGAFMTALGIVAPVANKLQTPIQVVDDTLCKGLDALQEKVPIVKEPPSQIVESAKTKVTELSISTVVQAHSITNQVLSTRCGNLALYGLDTVSSTADNCIDYFLPAAEGEENPHPHPNSECEDKVLHTVHTVGTVSTKVGRRVYNRFAGSPTQEAKPDAEDKPKDQ